ncbi:MAG TPA: hypothetical protein VJM50_17540 [Pyrinomonadaceae bacterium]|nr:hypothetical protein [Pyrinomonadaceae bacterium]
MLEFIKTHGRALDISGAFSFAALFLGCFAWGHYLFALFCLFAAVAFFYSLCAWNAYDWSQGEFNRSMCAISAALAAVLFIFAVAEKVLA